MNEPPKAPMDPDNESKVQNIWFYAFGIAFLRPSQNDILAALLAAICFVFIGNLIGIIDFEHPSSKMFIAVTLYSTFAHSVGLRVVNGVRHLIVFTIGSLLVTIPFGLLG